MYNNDNLATNDRYTYMDTSISLATMKADGFFNARASTFQNTQGAVMRLFGSDGNEDVQINVDATGQVTSSLPNPVGDDPAAVRLTLVGYADAVGGTTDIVIDTNDTKVDWELVSASAVLLQEPSAGATLTAEIQGDFPAFALSDIITFTQGVDIVGDVKRFVPVPATVLGADERLAIRGVGTTVLLGHIQIFMQFKGV